MIITADAMLKYVLVAIGGFLVKTFLDWIKTDAENKVNKAKKYDEQEFREEIIKIVKETQDQLKQELIANMTTFQTESKATFDYWQKMYWEAVDHLKAVEKDFLSLREQDLVFFKYQLINSCKKYLSKGHMTQSEFDRLSELHKIYNTLGGNSQGDLYYNKAIALPIISEHGEDEFEDFELFVNEEDMKSHNK